MAESKLALDSYSELKLLTDVWNIYELVENNERIEALKAIRVLIGEIRYSDIIDTYTLFDPMDEMRQEDVINEIKLLVKEYDNDEDLGGNVRAFVTEHLK